MLKDFKINSTRSKSHLLVPILLVKLLENYYTFLDKFQQIKGQLIKGKLGKDLTTEEGYEAAKDVVLAIISQVKKACDNDLSKVKSCIKLTGYVNSTDDFTDQPKVINGASEIIAKIFDEKGLHTRAAVSSNSLPLGVAVEVDAIFEIN